MPNLLQKLPKVGNGISIKPLHIKILKAALKKRMGTKIQMPALGSGKGMGNVTGLMSKGSSKNDY